MEPEQLLRNWEKYLAGEVTTDTSVRPDKIDTSIYGNHCSYGDGKIRKWRFEDKRGYFKFLVDYWNNLKGMY